MITAANRSVHSVTERLVSSQRLVFECEVWYKPIPVACQYQRGERDASIDLESHPAAGAAALCRAGVQSRAGARRTAGSKICLQQSDGLAGVAAGHRQL